MQRQRVMATMFALVWLTAGCTEDTAAVGPKDAVAPSQDADVNTLGDLGADQATAADVPDAAQDLSPDAANGDAATDAPGDAVDAPDGQPIPVDGEVSDLADVLGAEEVLGDAESDLAPDMAPADDAVDVAVTEDAATDAEDVQPGVDVEDTIASPDVAADGFDVAIDAEADAAVDAGPQCLNAADCPAVVGNPCSAAACVQGKCATQAAPDGQACDDGLACTTGDACAAQACVGKAISCDDGNACTADACAAATGACSHTATVGSCSDGDACTAGDSCQDSGCKGGVAKLCDDGNPCTKDSCEVVSGSCAVTATAGGCDDGSVCTAGDTCQDGTCQPGSAKTCDDGNPCTDDGCDAKAGCTAVANASPCAAPDACLLGVCTGGACEAGQKKGCDDNNLCTQDTCDPQKGCVYTAVDSSVVCANGDACAAASTCSAGQCVTGKKTDCVDGNACTTDSCEAAVGCVWKPNTAPCEDGDKCTAGDLCANGKCLIGKLIDPQTACEDGNPCTNEGCDAKTGCTHMANAGSCDDGTPCTTGEACKDGSCQGGKPTLCDDGKVCTNDQCDVKTGACAWTAKGGACSDGDGCTAGDTCQAATCVPGPVVVCQDDESCTTEACDKASGQCIVTPVPGGAATPCDGSTIGGRCVKVTKGAATATWAQAEAACKAWGGHLAHIQSSGDNAAVRGMANQICGNGSTPWLGLTDQASENVFTWADGAPATYLNWSTNQPDNCVGCCAVAGAGEDVVHMFADGTWNDLCVNTPQPCWVCERPIPTVACGNEKACTAKGLCQAGKCTGAVSSCDDGNPCTTDSCGANSSGCQHVAAAAGSPCGTGTCGQGVCSPGADPSSAVTSCKALLAAAPASADGIYWIDPDGAVGPISAAQTQCRMSLGGGGWTLVAMVADDGQATWTWAKRQLWTTDLLTIGSATVAGKDFRSPLMNQLPFGDLLFVHEPSTVWAAYANVGDGKQALGQKIAAVGGPVCWTPAQGWPQTAGTLAAGGTLCSTKLYMNADDHDGKATCGDNEQSWGPTWSVNLNNGCPFDDPGQSGSLGPLLNQPTAEQAAMGFGAALGLNKGKAGTGQNAMRVYVR